MTMVDGIPVLGPSAFERGSRGPNPVESDVGFLDAISGPAWRRHNVVANIVNGTIATSDEIAASDRVDVWGQIEGTKYENRWNSFAGLTTSVEVIRMKQKIDLEEDDRRVIEEAGFGGFAAEAIATVIDLPTLLPFGAAVGATRAGLGVMRVGARTALAAGAEATFAEGILQATQETRTGAESAFAIGGSVMLGYLLGSALSAVVGRTAEGRVAFQKTSNAIQEGADKFGASPSDLSAAAKVLPEITDFDLPTAAAQALKDSTPSGLSFTDRFAKARSAVARLLGTKLIGNEYAFRGQERLAIDPAAELFAGLVEDKARVVIAKVFKDDYNAYRKAARDDGRPVLKNHEFRERVSVAMRRGDADPLYPEVTKAALKLRDEVVEPMKNEAIRMGLLPEGVTVQTAVSYFTRMWDSNRIVARSDVFLDRLTAEFSRGLKSGAIRQQDTAQSRVSALENELFDLTNERLDAGDLNAQRITEFLSEEGDIQRRITEVRRETSKFRKRPVGEIIREAGGIDPKGHAAAELRSLGVTTRTSPGLFRRGGLKDVDNIDAGLADDLADVIGRDRDFLDRQGVLNALADEGTRGVARRTPGDQALLDELDDLLDLLEAGRRLVDEKSPTRRADLKRAKELTVKIRKAEEVARAAAVKADFTVDEIAAFSRAAAEDVMRQLTDPGVSPTQLLNVTVTTRGPLNNRTLNVRDIDYEDFLINDAEFVLNRYARVMAAETALTKRFGRPDMRDQLADVNTDYARIRDAATTAKQRKSIEAERRRVVESLEAARDQVRGTYLVAERASSRYRMIQGAMTFNYVRALGDVVKSSLPDVFKITMVNGVRNLWNDALVPLIKNAGTAKASRKQIAEVAGIAEVLLNSRMMRIADIADPHAVRTPIESTLNYMAGKASLFSGIMHWNQFLKEIAGVLSMNRLRRIDLSNISQRDVRFMGRIKLTRANLERIQEQMRLHGQDTDGSFIPNTKLWDDDISLLFGVVVRADADTVIVTPGIGDKIPLVERAWWLKPAIQFKAFALAAHRKTLLVGLQEDQGRFLSNAALSISMGMFIYWLKAQSREKGNLSDNPGVWLAEGIDRSAMLPIYMEINNMAERVGAPGVYYGLGSIFGEAPERASRFQVRGVAGAVLGPTFGLLTDAVTVANAALTGDVDTGDIRAGKRLVPFGNHPGMKEFLNLWVVPELRSGIQ